MSADKKELSTLMIDKESARCSATTLLVSVSNINIDICSIKLKWDGKPTEMWYDNEMKWIRISKWNRGDL